MSYIFNIRFIVLTLIFSTFSWASISSKQKDIILTSGKRNSARSYAASTEKVLPFPIDVVKNAITNFKDKCNNEFRNKRKFTPKNFNCKYHNNNLIETFEIKNLKHEFPIISTKDKDKTNSRHVEISILGRQIYNRGNFNFYELLRVEEEVTSNQSKQIIISGKMLNDHEVKKFISPEFKKESAFNDAHWSFKLTEETNQSTKVHYEYNALTDHWLLNKEISVPQVFKSLSDSVYDLIHSVVLEASHQISLKTNLSQVEK